MTALKVLPGEDLVTPPSLFPFGASSNQCPPKPRQ